MFFIHNFLEYVFIFSQNSFNLVQLVHIFYCDGFLFPCPPFCFSVSSGAVMDGDLHSFASVGWGFGLVLPPIKVPDQQPEVTGKPEVNRKTVRTAR